MDQARGSGPERPRRNVRTPSVGGQLGLTAAFLVGIGAACSGLTNNNDGIERIEIVGPANFFLEIGTPTQLKAVALNQAGDSVAADFRWRTPDTTVTLDSLQGIITARLAAGTARVQLGVFGKDTIATSFAGLTFTLTAHADTLILVSADSVDVPKDTTGTPIRIQLAGGVLRTGVTGRPVSFRVIDPAPADTPAVAFTSGRVKDSLSTDGTGVTSSTVRGVKGRPVPDRAVVEINAYRASGVPIPGSGRRVVIRFRHQ